MADQKYVTLILGAGSSFPYGFPLGPDLIKLIINEATSVRDNAKQNVTEYNKLNAKISQRYGSGVEYTKFLELLDQIAGQLSLYKPQSIDSFLNNLYAQNDRDSAIFVDVTRYLLSCVITKRYSPSSYFKDEQRSEGKPPSKWLHQLLNAIFYWAHKKNYELEELPIKIVTFNYDTLLEQYFCELVKGSYFLPDEHKQKIIELFLKSVTHVYGQLGYFKWKGIVLNAPKDYQSEEVLDLDVLSGRIPSPDSTSVYITNHQRSLALNSFHRISLVPNLTSSGDDQETFRHKKESTDIAINWIENAKTLIVSGYAFDNTNNDIIKLRESAANVPNIYVTLYEAGYALKSKVDLLFRQCSKKVAEPFHPGRPVSIDGQYVHDSPGNINPELVARIFNSTTHTLLSKEVDLVQSVFELSKS